MFASQVSLLKILMMCITSFAARRAAHGSSSEPVEYLARVHTWYQGYNSAVRSSSTAHIPNSVWCVFRECVGRDCACRRSVLALKRRERMAGTRQR